MFVHPTVDFFLVSSLHIARLLLNLLHLLTSLEFFLLHIASQILSPLFVFKHASGLLFLPIPIFSLDVVLKIADLLLQLVSLLLLDEDLLRHVRQLSLVSVSIHDLEDGKGTISTGCVQKLIVIADANTVHSLRVSLNLKDFVTLEGIHDDLDTTRLVGFIDSGEECPAVVHHLDLIQIDTLLELLDFLAIFNQSDRLVLASGEDLWSCLISDDLVNFEASKIDVGNLEAPLLALLALLGVQSPHVDVRIEGGRAESSIVLEPGD